MQFITDRQSLAQEFAFQTEKDSSYLLSSRASRRRILYEDGLDPASQQIQDFKQQIELKYTQSIANKIYTFPFSYSSIDMFDESEFKQLQGDVEISLYDSQQHQLRRNKFKILNKKIKNQKVNSILAQIKGLKQNMMTLTLYRDDSLCQSSQTKPTQNVSTIRNKSKQLGEKSSRIKPNYETLNSQQESPNGKRHMHTQPYEKPLGYIIKKK